MRWNASKTYLLDLAAKGAPLPPTRLVEPTAEAIAAAMDDMGLDRAVAKPEFGATASGLSLVENPVEELEIALHGHLLGETSLIGRAAVAGQPRRQFRVID